MDAVLRRLALAFLLLVGVAPPDARAAIAFVRSTGKFEVGGNNTVSGSFAALPTSGDLIVVIASVGSTAGAVSSVSDNQGNTYTLFKSPSVGIGLNETVIARTMTGATAGTFTITVSTTGTAGGTFLTAVGLDYSGASALDVTGTNSCASCSALTAGAITPTKSGDLVIAAVTSNLGSNQTWTDNQAAPWTQRLLESTCLSFECGVGDENVGVGCGAVSASWSISSAAGSLTAAILSMTATGAAGCGGVPERTKMGVGQ